MIQFFEHNKFCSCPEALVLAIAVPPLMEKQKEKWRPSQAVAWLPTARLGPLLLARETEGQGQQTD